MKLRFRKAPRGGYGTHLQPLLLAVFNTTGPVIELGAGDYSTTILHEVCKQLGRQLFTYENDPEWLSGFADLASADHKLVQIGAWKQVPAVPCGVLLVDHAPAERRVVEIARFRDLAQIQVVHDTDKMDHYGYAPAFAPFRYRATYERYLKTTTLLSNQIDVAALL